MSGEKGGFVDNSELVKLFNRVIQSEELDKKIIYKIIRDITSDIDIFPKLGKISISEIRSHITDEVINNNFFVKIGDNQYFNIGINDGFDDTFYQLRCNFDFYEKLFDMKLTNEEIHYSTKAIINFDIFLGGNEKVAKIVLKNISTNMILDDNPLRIINVNADLAYETLSRNIDDIKLCSKSIRWGSIFNMTNIEDISSVLGNDMLSSKEKENFLNVISTEYNKLKEKNNI